MNVNRLLHDAEHAMSGRIMANMMKDKPAATAFLTKARRLYDEASRLDPHHVDDAWNETTLRERP